MRELTGAPAVLPEWLSDVAVVNADIPASLPDAAAAGVLWAAAPGRCWVEVPGVARYLAAAGAELTLEPVVGADPADVVRFARMAPLAALCYQRGIVAWHAATAVRDGQAVILAGDSAAGKSTLLASLLARGWGMLGDELAPVTLSADGTVTVLATGDEIRLWPDVITRLGDEEQLGAALPLPPDDGRGWARSLAAGTRALSSPVPVRTIWRLALHNHGETEITTDEGFDRFDAVGRLAYNGRLAHALLDRRAYLQLAATVASNIPHHLVQRPRGEWTVSALADMIERDFVRSAASGG